MLCFSGDLLVMPVVHTVYEWLLAWAWVQRLGLISELSVCVL